MVELRDVFDFPPSPTFKTSKTRFRTPPRASFFSSSFRRKPPDGALFRIRFTYFAKRTRVASGQIIPRFVESGAPFRRRRRRFDAVSYFIAISAPKRVLFRKVRAFSSKKRPKKEKKRSFSRFFYSDALFRPSVRRVAAFFSSFGVKLAVDAPPSSGVVVSRRFPFFARFRVANAIKKRSRERRNLLRRSLDRYSLKARRLKPPPILPRLPVFTFRSQNTRRTRRRTPALEREFSPLRKRR